MTLQERLKKMATEARYYQIKIDQLEGELLETEAKLQDILDHDMPELMDEAGISEFKDSNGTKYTIKESCFVSLRNDNKEPFYQWCIDNHLEAVIKTTINVPLGKDRLDDADNLIEKLKGGLCIDDSNCVKTFDAGRTSKIESQTLRKLANDRLTAGESWPEELAPATIVRRVKIQ